MNKIVKGLTKNDRKSEKKENLGIEKVDIHIFCGKCGKEIKMKHDFIVNKCIYCSKILCEKCMVLECVNPSSHRIAYCKDCWDAGEEYRPIIEELESKMQNAYTEWRHKCRCVL